MSKFKGIVFPSFKEPPSPTGKISTSTRSLPEGKQYLPHGNSRAMMRNLRHVVKKHLDSKDPDTIEALNRVRMATSTEQNAEHSFLHLLYIANLAAEKSSTPICLAVHLLMNQLEQTIAEKKAEDLEVTVIEEAPNGTELNTSQRQEDNTEGERPSE